MFDKCFTSKPQTYEPIIEETKLGNSFPEMAKAEKGKWVSLEAYNKVMKELECYSTVLFVLIIGLCCFGFPAW
jgi:hypothetical protein